MPTTAPTTTPSGTPTTTPSGTPTTTPSGTPTTSPTGTPTTAPTGTPTTAPTGMPTNTPTLAPTATPTPTPTATPTSAPVNTLSIDQPTVTLCAPMQGNAGEATYGCSNSGTGASVHTTGVTGQLTATSQTGVATATVVTGGGVGFPAVSIGITAASSGGGFLTGTDTITIRDSGTGNVATVPVAVIAGGTDGTGFITGAGYFALLTGDQACIGSAGTLTPSSNSTGSAITAVSNNASIATIAPSGSGFAYSFLAAGSTYYTLTAGTNTEIVPVNVEAHVPGANSC